MTKVEESKTVFVIFVGGFIQWWKARGGGFVRTKRTPGSATDLGQKRRPLL